MSNNPYQAPSTIADTPIAETVDEIEKPNVGSVSLKWLVICAISAAPSFFWGFLVGEQPFQAATGMILGVLTFVVGYTIFECQPFAQRLLRDRHVKRTAKIGYGTRIGISIIFPIALYLDLIVGLFAISTMSFFTGVDELGLRNLQDASNEPSVLWFFATTVVQGIYLNIILFGYMIFVYVLVRLFSRP